jgi:AraC family transcriptional regulator
MNTANGKTFNTFMKCPLLNGYPDETRPLLRTDNEDAADVEYLDDRESLSDKILEQNPRLSVLDRSVQSYPSDAVKRYSIGCNSFIAETIYAPAGSKIYVRYRASAHLLVLYEEGSRRRGETSIRGLAASTLRAFSKKLTFVPAGLCFREWQETDTPIRITYLFLDPVKLHEFTDASGNHVPRLLFEDAVLWETATKLKSAIENNQGKSNTYLEAIANVLAHELSGTRAGSDQTSHANRGGLAGWQMRAVANYIDEHLDQEVSLPMLARLVRLSPYHFCRAFKRSFNTSPHRYHVQRRVEQAKVLLSNRRISITAVGLSVGYPYPGSFSIAFRKITRQTPSEFRRNFVLSADDEEFRRISRRYEAALSA